MKIAIKEIPAFPFPATHVCVSDGHVALGVGANFQYMLMSYDGTPVSQAARISLSPEHYESWGASDEELANVIVRALGLEPLENVKAE
jgi:hypothetical protein